MRCSEVAEQASLFSSNQVLQALKLRQAHKLAGDVHIISAVGKTATLQLTTWNNSKGAGGLQDDSKDF